MLHLIPAPLHRRLYRFADWARRRWWRVRKPHRTSALVAAFDEGGRVLLVRHSYGPAVWTVPGGGVRRDEDPGAAAIRELREELGCGVAELVALAPREAEDSGSHDRQHLFLARLDGEPAADQREIVAVGWFDPASLPANCSRYVAPIVARALRQRSQQR